MKRDNVVLPNGKWKVEATYKFIHSNKILINNYDKDKEIYRTDEVI